MVCPLYHLHCDDRVAGRIIHALHRHKPAGLIDGFDLRDARVVRGGCDRTVALAVHRKGGRSCTGISSGSSLCTEPQRVH